MFVTDQDRPRHIPSLSFWPETQNVTGLLRRVRFLITSLLTQSSSSSTRCTPVPYWLTRRGVRALIYIIGYTVAVIIPSRLSEQPCYPQPPAGCSGTGPSLATPSPSSSFWLSEQPWASTDTRRRVRTLVHIVGHPVLVIIGRITTRLALSSPLSTATWVCYTGPHRWLHRGRHHPQAPPPAHPRYVNGSPVGIWTLVHIIGYVAVMSTSPPPDWLCEQPARPPFSCGVLGH